MSDVGVRWLATVRCWVGAHAWVWHPTVRDWFCQRCRKRRPHIGVRL